MLGSRRRPADYVPVADTARAAAALWRAIARGEEAFVGVLPRLRAAPRREEVHVARCLWLDLDSAEKKRVLQAERSDIQEKAFAEYDSRSAEIAASADADLAEAEARYQAKLADAVCRSL